MHVMRFILVLMSFCLGLNAAYADDNAQIQLQAQQNLSLSATAETAAATPPSLVPPSPNIDAKGYVLMDADSGAVLAQQNMNDRLPPASLTKLMTLYVAFEALKSGQIHMTDSVHISTKAWQMGGSRMFIKENSDVPLETLIQGIIVASGNDACVATAQFIGGTEETFTQLMNQAATQLGMKNSHYTDSTGLPDPQHYSTPYDLGVLTRALINDFPDYYHYFAQKWLTYNGIKQPNRNRLLWRDTSVDGLKTGHTEEAGFCLVASAKRNGMRLIAVVMGAPSDSARANDSEALLNYGFRFYQTHQLFPANKAVTQQRIWMGAGKYVGFGLAKPLFVTIPSGSYKNLQASLSLDQHLKAPIVKGQAYGQVGVTLNGQTIATVPLVALQSDDRGGAWKRMMDHLAMFFKGLFTKSSS